MQDLRRYSHDLTESTRAMAKRGSDDLKKLAAMQTTLVRVNFGVLVDVTPFVDG